MKKNTFFIYAHSDLAILNSPAFYPAAESFCGYQKTPAGTFRLTEGGHGFSGLLYHGRHAADRRVRKIFGLPRGGYHLRHALKELAATHRLMPFCPNSAAAAAAAGCSFVFPGEFLENHFWLHFDPMIQKKLSAWWRSFPWRQTWTVNWLKEGVLRFRRLVQDHELSMAIGQGIMRSGASEIQHFSRKPQDSTSEPCSTDIAIAVWKHMFPDLLKPFAEFPRNRIPIPNEDAEEAYDGLPLRNAILFCIVSYEVARLLPLVRETVRGTKRKVVVCYYGSPGEPNSYHGLRQAICDAGATPVYIHPELFQKEAKQATPLDHQLAESAAEHLAYSEAHAAWWRHIEQWLWPQYEGLLAWWSEFMRKNSPACCITSEALLAESSIPRMAAQRYNIPTIGIPHAYAYGGLSALGNVDVEHFACTTPFQRKMLESNNHVECTYSFQQIDLKNEYPVKERPFNRSEKAQIVFFHIATQTSTYLHFICEPQRHISFLSSTLRSIPPELHDLVEIKHKVHPAIPDYGAITLAGIENNSILPLELSADAAFASSDIAISYNYAGAPFLHSMRFNTPSILFIDTSQSMYKSYETTFYLEAVSKYHLLMATAPHELWELVLRLLHDPEYRSKAIANQRHFQREQLTPERNDWNEWLADVTAKKDNPVAKSND